MEMLLFNATHNLAWARTKSSEWPPRSKKLSWMPTCSNPNVSAQTWATVASTGVRGAVYPPGVCPAIASGEALALRLTFPLGVKGSDSSTTNAPPGTM